MNNANSIAWMPGCLLTNGRSPAFASPEDIAEQLNTSGGMRHREIQRLANVVRHVDLAITRMMRQEVRR